MNLTDAVATLQNLHDYPNGGLVDAEVEALEVVLAALAASPIVVVTEHLPPVAPALPDAPPTSGGSDA